MTENFEYEGEWFLPSAKSQRVNGILSYDFNQGISLELFGNFDNNPLTIAKPKEGIIQGITSDSKQITLYDCLMSKSGGAKLVMGEEIGMPPTIYRVNYIFEGVHIDTPAEVKFQKIVSEIHNLDEWIGISGFMPSSNDFESFKEYRIDVRYKLPEPINFAINDDINGQFNFIVDLPDRQRYQKEIRLKQRVEVTMTSNSEYTIEELLKYLFKFQNFLVLALYNRTYPNSIILYNDKFSKEIKLYFRIANRGVSNAFKSDLEMLFSYGDIQNEFPVIMKNWFGKYDLLEPAFNLLFEQFYNHERFSENTFLNLAQAAETFHARTNNHTKMPKEEFDKMKEDICSAVPEKYHDWLKDQFNFGNNLNLHTRLTEIVSKYSNATLDKIIKDRELFVKQVKWSRNYYTHYSSSGERQALKGIDLFYLSDKLKIVLVCAFLIEVGFDKEKLENLFKQKSHIFFNHLVQW